jgi:hypothetical protein
MPDPATDTDFEFSEFLKEFGHGVPNRILGERMREVIRACKQTGAKGSITIKIDMAAKSDLAEVKIGISSKRPEPGMPNGFFFTTEDGSLVEEDPRQMKLAPKVLNMPGVRNMGGGNGSNNGGAS